MALLHAAISQLRRLQAACSHSVRAFRDWCQRPSASELRGLKLLSEWLSQEQLAQYGRGDRVRGRPSWSADAKAEIMLEALASGAMVSDGVRRHAALQRSST